MGLPKQLLSNVTQEDDKEEVEEGGRRVGPFHGRRLLYGHFVTRERERDRVRERARNKRRNFAFIVANQSPPPPPNHNLLRLSMGRKS